MISKELLNKISYIIYEYDHKAYQKFYHGMFDSRHPGNIIRDYSSRKEDDIIGYLTSVLSDSEKEEMKNFTIDDLNKILYYNDKFKYTGIQLCDIVNRNKIVRKGRWNSN